MNGKKSRMIRFTVLVGILIYVTYEAYMHQILGGAKAPSVHALCPFGALESLYALLFSGTLIQKIYIGTVVLLGLTLLIGVLFRRSFCGLLCPFGALQEIFAKIGQFLFKKRFIMPEKLDRPLRGLKYVVLGLTLFMAWITGTLWMSSFDPYVAYGHLFAIGGALEEDPLAIIGFLLLAITVIGSLIYDRFFCKYICPMGAFTGLVGKLSPMAVRRHEDQCINCNRCSKACPVNIDVAKAGRVSTAECISCNECVTVCPKKGALQTEFGRKNWSPLIVLALVLTVFFGGVFIADSFGYMTTKQELAKPASISILEVKGFYTIEEAAKAVGWTLEETYQKLGIPESVPKSTKMKEISQLVPEFSFDEAKAKASGE